MIENNNEYEQLDQQMLELVYELLPKDEAAALKRRIAEEPEVAAAFARAEREAGVFAAAAKWHEAPIPMRSGEQVRSTKYEVQNMQTNAAGEHSDVHNSNSHGQTSLPVPPAVHSPFPIRHSPFGVAGLRRTVQWAVGIAATVLFAFLLGGYLHHRGRLSVVAARHLRVTVTGPSQLVAGVDNYFQVKTTDVLGEPQSVRLECALSDAWGNKLVSEDVRTNAEGLFKLAVPADISLPLAARLEVLAFHQDEAYRLEAAVPQAPYRFLTKLSTDKPLYRPGEIVRFRSLTLGRFGLDVPGDFPVHFEIHDPAGSVVAGSETQGITQRGVGNGAFQLQTDRAGGEYKLVARSLNEAFPEEKRSFFVREYRTPALKKDLEFTRDSYSPGDHVVADFSVNKAQGGPAAGAQLTFTATVDGQTVHEASDKASASGTFRIEFELPKSIERGDAQLAIRVDDGGTQETIAKTIPINLGKVEVKFYPEGGDLVAGLENRVYFAACDPLGKPAHVEGTIVDDAGQKVVEFETRHKGMGLFACTPKKGSTYHVRLTKPAEVKTESRLPPVSEERSVVLSTGRGVFEPDRPIEAELCSTEAERPMVVAAYCRGMQVGQTSVTTKLGKSAVTIPVPEGVGGVIRLTVFDYSKRDGVEKSADSDAKGPRAVAERLVYRRPDRRLNVAVADHREQYAPGDKVELSLIATNENGQSAKSAALGVAVVDDSLLKLADDDSPAMPTHFYLTSEVDKPEDLEKADFYLSDDTKADEALDLLLGTQGWRRFVERKFEDLQQKAKEAGQPVKPEQPVERLLALGGAALPPTVLDNFDDVRRQYDEARSQADADYRAAVAQLSRAAVFGGLLLGGLLVAINVAPLIRRPGEWSWLLISRRFGPATVVVGLCVLVGVLWMPKATNLAESDLVAWQEFKLQLPKLAEPGSESRHATLLKGLDAQNLNRINRHWYWSRGERWGDTDLALQPGEQEFAYFDMYGFDWRDKALKRGEQLFGDVELEFLPALDRIVIRGHPRDAQRVEEIIRQIEALGEDGYRILYPTPDAWADFGRGQGRYIQLAERDGADALSKWGAYQNGWHYANKQRLGFQIDGEVVAADYDAFLKQYKVQIEQLRFPVREYAHQHTAGEPGVRSDFTETVCWNPLLVTDENGRASINFDLADSITSYRVMTEAHDGAGRIGTGNGVVIAKLPFVIDPKLPLEVNAGDRIEIPVAVSNESVGSLEAALSCKVGGTDDVTPSVPTTMGLFKLIGDAEQRVAVSAGSMARTYFTVDVVGQKGTEDIEVRGAAGTHADAKRQAIRVVPPGFPVAESYAGRLAGEQEVTIAVPESVVPGTLEVTLAAYPSTIATLQSGLEGVLREPSGCFEQASSSNYPNLLLLQYLEENKVSQPELMRKGKEYLRSGYTRLTGYECPSKGFEWFGADPGHEALTAYGLLEFRDMARVHEVDAKLLDRTAEWLLARRDGKGGFQRNDKKLDGFGAAPAQITNAYIVWALSESGQQGIDNELTQSIDHARRSSDPYEVALAAASAVNCNREPDGRALLGKLTTLQGADGQLVGTEGSITRSGGAALAIETTALAALAWLKLPEFRAQANRAIDWIIKNRSGDGSFGSTQATILALKALVEHAKASHGSVTGGELIVKHGDAVIGTQKFAADEVNTIKLAEFEGKLTSGENHLTISLTGENQMPYTIDVSYRARRPQSHPDCAVELSTKLTSTEIKAGETVALEAELANKTEQGQPMTVAILGLPAGLQPRADQLEELKKAGTIDYYETRAREVICYWRSLAPKKRVPIKLDLVAEWPGRYTAPASRAYLYYTAEQKQWVEPLAIEIKR